MDFIELHRWFAPISKDQEAITSEVAPFWGKNLADGYYGPIYARTEESSCWRRLRAENRPSFEIKPTHSPPKD
jgi:hypothetical protein